MKKILTFIIAALSYTSYAGAQTKIPIDEVSEHRGEMVTVCDMLYSGKFIEKSKLTLIEMGGHDSKTKVIILINPADRKNFPAKPETFYERMDACITGKVVEFKGKPGIVVSKPSDIQIGTE